MFELGSPFLLRKFIALGQQRMSVGAIVQGPSLGKKDQMHGGSGHAILCKGSEQGKQALLVGGVVFAIDEWKLEKLVQKLGHERKIGRGSSMSCCRC